MPPPTDESSFDRAKRVMNEFNEIDDGYDYSQHLREVGKGTLYSADGNILSRSEDLMSKKVELPDELLASETMEHDRQLDSIALTTDMMETDLREALINDNAFEEIDDDFMTQVA